MKSSNISISTTTQKVEGLNAIAIYGMDYSIFDGWNRSYKTIYWCSDILKRYTDKETESLIKSPTFLFSAAIWSHLAHS